MVEIKPVIRKIGLLAGAAMLMWGVWAQEPRIAGLEGNADYQELLHADAQLRHKEDSIVNAVEQLRQQLRDDPERRQIYSQSILALENQIFNVRSARGRVVGHINAIEQDWVMANLSATPAAPSEPTPSAPTIPDSLKVRNLIYNPYFRQNLPTADYAALREAQQRELRAVDYVNRYFSNYQTLAQLAAAYAEVQSEGEALELYGRYTTLQGLNGVLADSLAQTWNYIFDNKSYAYGYLMDKLRQDEVLAREEERLSAAVLDLAALRGQTTSDAVADYFLRKRVAVDYEQAVAQVLGLDAAVDSLRGVMAQLKTVDFKQPRIEVEQRTFLQYDSVSFPAATQYTTLHPIPECRIYAKGTIYRILLGSFTSKRAVSTFRGTYPIGYLVDAEGKWNYYAGGFATREAAEQAQKKLKARGFARPEIVVWNDGVQHNLSRDPEAAAATYRIEILGADVLSDAVKEILTTQAGARELSRVGQQMFVVGTFADKAEADRVAAALSQTDSALEIKVVQIVATE